MINIWENKQIAIFFLEYELSVKIKRHLFSILLTFIQYLYSFEI